MSGLEPQPSSSVSESGASGSVSPRKGCVSLVGRVAIVLLWVGLVVILVETTAYLALRKSDLDNPWIAAYRDQLPLPAPPRSVALTGLDQLPTGTPMLPWMSTDTEASHAVAATTPSGLDAFRVTIDDGVAAVDESAIAAFHTLDESEREMFAALHRMIIIEVDDAGRARIAHGLNQTFGLVPFLRFGVALANWRQRGTSQDHSDEGAAAPSGSPPEFSFSIRDSSRPVTVQPSKVGAPSAYWFIPIVPTEIRHALAQSAPEDSLWKNPYLYLRPGYDEERPPGAGDFRINSHGYRSPEFAIPKPPGVYRILCIGGSTTEEGSRMSATYPSQLEERLRARFPDRSIEVINAGVSGIKSTGHLWKFPEYVQFEPDLIVAYMGINDILLDCLPRYRWFEAPHWTRLVRYLNSTRRWGGVDFSPTVGDIAPLMEARLFTKMLALGRGARASGIPFVMCSVAHPDLTMMEADEIGYIDFLARSQWREPYMGLPRYIEYIEYFNSRLAAIASEEGHPFIPVAAHLRGGTELFGDICHMYDEGIALKAEIIYRYLVGE